MNAPTRSDLEVLTDNIAALEADCRRKLKDLGKWSANESYNFEHGPLKELKDMKRRRAVMLRGASK